MWLSKAIAAAAGWAAIMFSPAFAQQPEIVFVNPSAEQIPPVMDKVRTHQGDFASFIETLGDVNYGMVINPVTGRPEVIYVLVPAKEPKNKITVVFEENSVFIVINGRDVDLVKAGPGEVLEVMRMLDPVQWADGDLTLHNMLFTHPEIFLPLFRHDFNAALCLMDLALFNMTIGKIAAHDLNLALEIINAIRLRVCSNPWTISSGHWTGSMKNL